MKETFLSKLKELWAIRQHLKYMKPSEKSEDLEIELKRVTGVDRRAAITTDHCVPEPIGCGKPITTFRDDRSRKEYTISGLCQQCQDSIFGV